MTTTLHSLCKHAQPHPGMWKSRSQFFWGGTWNGGCVSSSQPAETPCSNDTIFFFLTLIIYACWPNRHYFTAMRTFAVAKLLFQKDYLNKYADLESTFNQLWTCCLCYLNMPQQVKIVIFYYAFIDNKLKFLFILVVTEQLLKQYKNQDIIHCSFVF